MTVRDGTVSADRLSEMLEQATRIRNGYREGSFSRELCDDEVSVFTELQALRSVPSEPVAMTVIDPGTWEPCSPGYLERGGKCNAPRVWNAAEQNHWHPKIQLPSPPTKEVTPAMVEVKPLEWSLDALTGRYWANTAIGRYHAWDVIGHAYFSLNDGSPVRAGMDDRTAKAAAQADFKSRILSALEVAP